jgi:hypothetical protein
MLMRLYGIKNKACLAKQNAVGGWRFHESALDGENKNKGRLLREMRTHEEELKSSTRKLPGDVRSTIP